MVSEGQGLSGSGGMIKCSASAADTHPHAPTPAMPPTHQGGVVVKHALAVAEHKVELVRGLGHVQRGAVHIHACAVRVI